MGWKATGGGDFIQIERQVLGAPASTITFDDIPGGFADLRITYSARTDRSDFQDEFIELQMGATTVDSGASDYGTVMRLQSSVADFDVETAARESIVAGIVGGAASSNVVFGGGTIDIINYADTGSSTQIIGHGGVVTTAGVRDQVHCFGTWYNTSDAVDIIVLKTDTGTDFIAGSVFTLYGLGDSS